MQHSTMAKCSKDGKLTKQLFLRLCIFEKPVYSFQACLV